MEGEKKKAMEKMEAMWFQYTYHDQMSPIVKDFLLSVPRAIQISLMGMSQYH